MAWVPAAWYLRAQTERQNSQYSNDILLWITWIHPINLITQALNNLQTLLSWYTHINTEQIKYVGPKGMLTSLSNNRTFKQKTNTGISVYLMFPCIVNHYKCDKYTSIYGSLDIYFHSHNCIRHNICCTVQGTSSHAEMMHQENFSTRSMICCIIVLSNTLQRNYAILSKVLLLISQNGSNCLAHPVEVLVPQYLHKVPTRSPWASHGERAHPHISQENHPVKRPTSLTRPYPWL